jgi:hypothetical protein
MYRPLTVVGVLLGVVGAQVEVGIVVMADKTHQVRVLADLVVVEAVVAGAVAVEAVIPQQAETKVTPQDQEAVQTVAEDSAQVEVEAVEEDLYQEVVATILPMVVKVTRAIVLRVKATHHKHVML